MKRSGKEARWTALPPAPIRFTAEAVFLILVGAGAALAQMSPLSIIGLMLIACLLVALIERASSRELAKAPAEAEETEVSSPGPAVRKHPLDLLEEPASAETAAPLLEPERSPEPPVPSPPADPPHVALPLAEPRIEPHPQPPPVEQVPSPPPERPPAPQPPPSPASEWNIWDLERRAREQAGDALRDEEWAALFMNLRPFANADGVLPMEFDDLVRESFSDLIQAA